jgi:flagellar export protein FliJ
MKAFHFSLQAVRTLRQRQEQTALEQYALSLRARQQATENWQCAQRECQLAWRYRQNLLTSGAMAVHIAQSQAHVAVMEARCQECETALHVAQEVAAKYWRHLIEARRKREAVDRFHDRQHGLYEKACAREEQKMLDEVGVRRGMAGYIMRETRENVGNEL